MIESLIQKNSLAILRCKAFCFLCRGEIGCFVGRAHCVTPFRSIQKSRILHAGFCLFQFVGETGFEPATFWSQTRRANRAALHPECLMAQR